MRIKYILSFLFFISIIFGQSKVHNLGKNGLEDALLMERVGDLEEAKNIYQLVLETKPKSRKAYNRLKNLHKQLGEYNEVVILINAWLLHSPHDIQQRVELGEVYFINGDLKDAYKTWNHFINEYGQNTTAYRMLVHTYSRLGLNENMILLVQEGRNTFAEPDFMALDLGNYYHAKQDVENALDQYLLFVSHNPKQRKVVIDKILLMSDEEDKIPLIENRLRNHINRDPDLSHDLLSSLYFLTGQYDRSLKEILMISEKNQGKFKRINAFATNLRKEGQFDLAIEAYNELLLEIRKNPDAVNQKELGNVLMGLGQVYEDQIQPQRINNSLILNEVNNVFFTEVYYQTQDLSTASMEQAIILYNTILNELEETTFSPKALFRLGNIQFQILQDTDGARKAYTKALTSRPDKNLEFKIRSKLIDLLLAEGRIQDAKIAIDEIPDQLISGNESLLVIQALKTLLMDSEIDSTVAILDSYIVQLTPMNKQFNDFMELRSLLQANGSAEPGKDNEMVQLYLQGEKLLAQHKLSEAVIQFENIRMDFPESPITTLATIREIFCYGQLQRNMDKEEALQWLISSNNGDKGLVLAGETAEFIDNDMESAVDYYEQLLQYYPSSIFSEPIRLRIRELKRQLESL